MSGPAPKPPGQRRRSNAPARGEWRASPGIGWQHGPVPDTPEDVGPAAEPVLPQLPADDDHAVRARAIVAGREGAAEGGLGAQHREGVVGQEGAVVARRRLAVAGEVDGALVVRGDALERALRLAPVEQVVVWNPDTVITWDPNFYEAVWQDFYWQSVDAVASGRVYLSPTAPFGWIDRPPSLNRMIGLEWLAGLFYPDQANQDLREVTRSFYDLFYHVDLTDAELDRLLQWAKGRAP